MTEVHAVSSGIDETLILCTSDLLKEEDRLKLLAAVILCKILDPNRNKLS